MIQCKFTFPFIGKQTSDVKDVKDNQPWFKSSSVSNQKPEYDTSLTNAAPSVDQNFSASQRTTSSTSNVDSSVKLSSNSPSGSRDFQMSSSDDLSSVEVKSAESEAPPEPVDNIPPSPFTLRASNCKKYQRPGRPYKMSSEPVENSSKTTEASAHDKPNSVLSAGASNTAAAAKTAAKPAGRGGGRVRDYTVLHPSCVSVCNVTIQDSIERSIDDLVPPAAPADLGEAGQMKKKSDALPPKPTR